VAEGSERALGIVEFPKGTNLEFDKSRAAGESVSLKLMAVTVLWHCVDGSARFDVVRFARKGGLAQ
jgi:hypothetical protein